MGIPRSMEFKDPRRCFTDGNGPEVFQPCAPEWVDGRTQSKNKFGQFDKVLRGCLQEEPPSYRDHICRRFYEKLKKIQSVSSGANLLIYPLKPI